MKAWRRLRPLRLWADTGDPLPPRTQARLFLALLVLGLTARALRYALRFPLWEDECFLAVNLIDRGFADLTEPLAYHQVAPILFLWLEAAVVRVAGFSEMTLRFPSFVLAVASLLLFARIVRCTLRGTAGVLAMAFFAPAYPAIRYAAEVKQYGANLFAGLLLVWLAVEWWRRPRRTRWLWALAAVTAPAVLLSYPAVFVAGGVSAWIAVVLWARRQRGGLGAWIVMNVMMLAAFAALFTLSARGQAGSEMGFMQSYWGHAFPPVTQPWKLPWWLISTHAGSLLAWPAGGERFASALTALCAGAGLVVLARRRPGLAALCVLPALVHLVAAALERYPYGGHVKFSMHLAAPITLLAGLGAAALLSTLRHGSERGRVPVLVAILAFAAVGAGSIVRDTVHPYKTRSDQRARAFAQWFWFNASFDGEVRCLLRDEHLGAASPATWSELSWSAMYLCNQAIARPGPPRREPLDVPPELRRTPPPLRCVLYRDSDKPFDEAVLDAWLAGMTADHVLVARERYPFARYDKRERRVINVDHVEIFTFTARRRP